MSDQAAPARNRCREEQPRNTPPGGGSSQFALFSVQTIA